MPGPTLKLNQPLPCGCRVGRETDGRLRLWFCRTHLAAFEMLETLQNAGRALDRVAESNPGDDVVEDTRFAVRATVVKARSREPW